MRTFDHSLKFLLHQAPADFIRFGLADPGVRVLGPVPTSLPARGRDVDGAYRITRDGDQERLVHIELHRRHQGQSELGTDVAEAQVRLFRREGKLVVSQVWDLYGDPDAPVQETRTLPFGADGSACVYRRINLRALRWDDLLTRAPPALWPLVALTRDGAGAAAIETTRAAIDGNAAWTHSQRADHLAVLRFVAEAEGCPGKLMDTIISEARLMTESALYLRILSRGETNGKTEAKAESVLAVLDARGISVSDTVRARVLGCTDLATLDLWIRRAAVASTAAAVVRARPRPAAKA